MALDTVSDDHHPNLLSHNHLTLDSIPHIDLRLLSQFDLYSLSLTSSSYHPTRRCDDDVLIPKIDRSVFNESAGSRKQTYSRLRLAPRNSQFQIPKPRSKTEIPISQPRDRETLQIITLLKQLFPSDTTPDDNDGSVVSIAAPEPSAQNALFNLILDADGSQRKRKRGRPRKDSNVVIAHQNVNVDVSVQNPGGDDTSIAIVVHGGDGRLPKDENGAARMSARRKSSVKDARVVAEEQETEMVMVNRNDVLVDLEALANADYLFGEALRRRTEGLETVAELLGFLGGLAGDWSSTRKKRKIVQATEFCDALPRHWKITLSLKRGGGRVRLFCRRYISPNGQQFVSCKEVSSYLISYFEAINQPKLGHTDGNIDVSYVMASGDDSYLAVKDDNDADERGSCSLVLNTSVSTGCEKPEALFHTRNSLEVQAGDAMGMRPTGSEQAMKADKNGKDLGLSEQGSEFSLTNDMLAKVSEATGAGPGSGVHLVYQRASNNQKTDGMESSGQASVVNCFRDGVIDGATASMSSVGVPNMDCDTALTGMGKECRTDNTDNSQLTSVTENTKLDVNDSGNGRSVSGMSESCIGPDDVYTNVKRQSTSEACSLVPSVVVQSPAERDSQGGLYRTFTDDRKFDESNSFISESFQTLDEHEFDDNGLSGNNDKTISFGSDHAMPDVDEHVISTGSCSDVPALDRQSCITLSDAKYPNCPVEELWKQKSFQSNVSNPFVKVARGSSETGMLFPSGYAQSYNMVSNVNTSSSSMKESEKEEVKRSWNSEAFLAGGHSGIGANSMTSSTLEDNFIVSALMRPNGCEKAPLFENNLHRDYSNIMWQQPNSEGAEKSGIIDPTTDFLNDSRSRDTMEDLMWRMDEQNAQQTGVADTSAALAQLSGYPDFDVFSGQGGNGPVSVNENFDNLSDLEGLKPGKIEWLDKQSLPSMANIARSCEIKNCSWCRNDFYNEVYETGTQTGLVGIVCPTCQAKFPSQYNFL